MHDKDIDVFVGNRIRTRRTYLGLTQKNVAQKLDITFQQFQKYESGANSMNSTKLYMMSQVLGVPINYFFYDAGDGDLFIKENYNIEHNHSTGISDILDSFNKIPDKSVRKKIADLLRSMDNFQ